MIRMSAFHDRSRLGDVVLVENDRPRQRGAPGRVLRVDELEVESKLPLEWVLCEIESTEVERREPKGLERIIALEDFAELRDRGRLLRVG